MEIKGEFKEEEGVFFIEENNERVGRLYFRKQGGDRIIIEHTIVSDKLKGKGAGKKLVDHAVAYAREHKLKIVPLCVFAKSVFEKFGGYDDVL